MLYGIMAIYYYILGSNMGSNVSDIMPSFPSSNSPDFLKSLTQVSESVGKSSEFVNVGKVINGTNDHSPCPAPDVNRAHPSPGTPQCPPSSGSNGPLTPASLPPSCPGSVSQTSNAPATGGSSAAPGSNDNSSSQRTPVTAGDPSGGVGGLDFDPMSVIEGDNQDMMNVSYLAIIAVCNVRYYKYCS